MPDRHTSVTPKSRAPDDLARELGIPPAVLRRWLATEFPTVDRAGKLTDEQIAAARRRFGNGEPGLGEHRPGSRLRAARRSNGTRGSVNTALVRARRGRERRRGRANLPRRIGIALGMGVVVLVGTVVAVAVIGWSTAVPIIASTCTLEHLRPIKLGQNSFVYAADGSLIGAVQSARNRQPVPIDQMSPWLPKATVAIEDRRFYQHGGIDLQGIARAALADLEAGRPVQGGSTITQQLVRNLYIGRPQDTLSRKLDEACLAVHLSERWSKERILQEYMNQVFYGAHAYGVEAAAETYFSRHASGLGIAQAALIAGLPQAPSVYDPFHNPKRAQARRNDVLAAMLSNGAISEAAYRKAIARPLRLERGHRYTRVRDPYFYDLVRARLVGRFGENRVRGGGLTVRTSLVPRLQRLADQTIAAHLPTPGDPAAALVAIDPATGRIKALTAAVPGRKKPLSFNLPVDGHRQAGSSFKPFTYVTAMEQRISPSSVWNGPPSLRIPDPECYTNGEPWDVHNYADEAAGTMPLTSALAASVNTIFAQVAVAVGPANIAEVAHRMGIASNLEAVCSITLGTQPVTPLEMTNAYATLASGGMYHPATPFTGVEDATGSTIQKGKLTPTRAVDENDAALTVQAMQGVVTHGTGVAASIGRPVAGKTGTAEDFKDAWFCGFVPQLTVCVWVGYPRGEISLLNVEGVPAMAGGTIPAEIWHDFTAAAVANLPIESFPFASTSGYDVFPEGSRATTAEPTTTKETTSTEETTKSGPTTTQAPPTTTQAPPTTTQSTETVPPTPSTSTGGTTTGETNPNPG